MLGASSLGDLPRLRPCHPGASWVRIVPGSAPGASRAHRGERATSGVWRQPSARPSAAHGTSRRRRPLECCPHGRSPFECPGSGHAAQETVAGNPTRATSAGTRCAIPRGGIIWPFPGRARCSQSFRSARPRAGCGHFGRLPDRSSRPRAGHGHAGPRLGRSAHSRAGHGHAGPRLGRPARSRAGRSHAVRRCGRATRGRAGCPPAVYRSISRRGRAGHDRRGDGVAR